MSQEKYIPKAKFRQRPQVITNMPDGSPVNLLGKDVNKVVAATKYVPEHETTIPGATQDHLRLIYEHQSKLSKEKEGFEWGPQDRRRMVWLNPLYKGTKTTPFASSKKEK